MKLFFQKKKEAIKTGDFVMMKRDFKNRFPAIPIHLALKIEKTVDQDAFVVFVNSKGNQIQKEVVPVEALRKIAG